MTRITSKRIIAVALLLILASIPFIWRAIDTKEGISPRTNVGADVTARTAASYVDSVGVQIYQDEVAPMICNREGYEGNWCFDNIVIPRLRELGVKHYRESLAPSSEMYPTLQPQWRWKLVQMRRLYSELGMKCTCSVFTPENNADDLPRVDQVVNQLKFDKQIIEAFHGPNEYNNTGLYWSPPHPPRPEDWTRRIRDYTQDVHAAIRAEPELNAIPIIGPSFVFEVEQDAIGNLSEWVDYGATNFYNDYWKLDDLGGTAPAGHLLPLGSPGHSIDYHLQHFGKPYPGKPMIFTETGYLAYHDLNLIPANLRGNFVTETVQAKYLPRRHFELFNRGIKRSFLYMFTDFSDNRSNEQGPATFGLLNGDGSPKPAFTTFANTLSLLKDDGGTFTPSALNFQITGNATNVHQTLLQKKNGSFFLVAWLEDENPSQDPDRHQTTTLELTTPVTRVALYDPRQGQSALTEFSNQQVVPLEVSDALTIIEIVPSAATPTPTPTSDGRDRDPTATPPGQGVNTPTPTATNTGSTSSPGPTPTKSVTATSIAQTNDAQPTPTTTTVPNAPIAIITPTPTPRHFIEDLPVPTPIISAPVVLKDLLNQQKETGTTFKPTPVQKQPLKDTLPDSPYVDPITSSSDGKATTIIGLILAALALTALIWTRIKRTRRR